MISAVLFDIGGTVHTQDGSAACDRDYAQRLYTYLAEHGITLPDDLELLLSRINTGAKAYKTYTEGELIELPNDEIWQTFMLKDYDFPKEKLIGLGEDLSYMFDRHKKVITKREGLEETLEALKQKGYRLGIISNIMSQTFVPRILEEHGVAHYFEYMQMSSVCMIRKPNPKIFDIALKDMGLSKNEVCYIGDTISRDVRGIRNAGWEMIIQIDNPRTYHKDEKYRGMGFKPDYLIHMLPEIVPIVEEYNKSQRERV